MKTPARNWTETERAMLISLYPWQRTADIARLMGIRLELVYSQASKMSLRKSPEFNATDKSGRIFKGGTLGQAGQFQPGQKPWNAGTHYHPGGRCSETQFKKGQMSGAAQRNYVPIGSVRVGSDGLLERKVTDDPALFPARRWVGVHRLVWIAAHGPIPPGHIIVFRPGQRTAIEPDITPDRLECITRRENAQRNHPNSSNPELARLIQLKGAITRQVNRITKEQHAS